LFFIALYILINPGLLNRSFAAGLTYRDISFYFGVVIYSVLLCYFILSLLRKFMNSTSAKLISFLILLLDISSSIFVYLVCRVEVLSFLQAMSNLIQSDTTIILETSFLLIKTIVSCLPYVFNILIIIQARKLIKELSNDSYSLAVIDISQKLAKLCSLSLVTITTVNVALNLLQLLLINRLSSLNLSINLPIFSLVFILATLLLTNLLKTSKELKDENEMII